MSVLVEQDWVFKGKSNCEAIVIVDSGLGQSPGEVSEGKAPKLRSLNGLQ